MSSDLNQIELNPVELDVLRMIVGNMSTNEIAFALDVEKTAIIKVSESIFSKLGATDSKSAAEIATKLDLINPRL